MREVLSKLRRVLASMRLVAVVCQMSLLVLPGRALAATNINGGTTSAIVNGSGVGFILSDLTVISENAGDIEGTNDIKIDISNVMPLSSAVVDFDTTATITAEVYHAGGGGLVINEIPSKTADDIEFTVTTAAEPGDYVVISGIKVKANLGGVDSSTYHGNAHLRVRTGTTSYTDTFVVDAQPPAIDSIVSDATAAGTLKVGD